MRKEIYTTDKNFNWSDYKVKGLFNLFLTTRLYNYGYDKKDFDAMKRKKYRLLKKIKELQLRMYDLDLSDFKYYRLGFYGNNVSYDTGQSFNEEFINLMELFLKTVKTKESA